MKKYEDVLNTVVTAIHELMGHPVEEITETANLTEDLGMDDIYAIRFMMKCEQAFNQEIDDKYFLPANEVPAEDMMRRKTVGEVVKYMASSLKSE